MRPRSKGRLRNILSLFAVGFILFYISSKRQYALNLYSQYDEDEDYNDEHPLLHGDSKTTTLPPPLVDVPSEPLKLPPPPPTPEDLEKQRYFPYCPPSKCAYGHWIPRPTPFTTFEEAHQAILFNKNDAGFSLPDPHPPTAEGVEYTEEEKKEGGRKRVLEMVNWIWQSDFGELVKFDVEEFVVRLLRSPGGLIIVGDSLTTQHLITLRHIFLRADFILNENIPSFPFNTKTHPDHFHHTVAGGGGRGEGTHIWQFALNVDHPPCKELVNRFGIFLERAKRPILTHIVDQTLISPEELNKVFRTEWGYEHKHKYTQVEGWEETVAEMFRPREGEKEGGVTEESLLVLSSGAHWSRAGLHGYNEQLPTEVLRRRIEYAYGEMVKSTIRRLSPLPHTTIFFRSISPGHPTCHLPSITTPFSSLSAAKEWFSQPGNDQAEVVDWDWDSFESRNEIWRRRIGEYEKDRTRGGIDDGKQEGEGEGLGGEVDETWLWKGKGARFVYLDFWSMDLQRIDAHTLTETRKGHFDCLHYALPYLHNQWTELLFHRLVVEKRVEEYRAAKELKEKGARAKGEVGA
ncbi:hypothetical protein D9758_015730 [Tetrapyrgos nigripes]|uniref:Uncharacterized protein n=1 Tax=Tetrapyrgos nigripes TaxID=182062 RepID=A0A8H5CRP4_9AGAR|nr:hypothetical protein D9758_015730 [Tetrapyrgos nigripes]